MWKYCLKKFLEVVVVIILISFFSFAIIYIAPGDVSINYIKNGMSVEQREEIRRQLGVNKSFPEQYFAWAKKIMRGDFGVSYANKSPVISQIAKRLPATIILMGTALALSILISIPLGLWAGYKKNTLVDYIISILTYIGKAIPEFALGMFLVLVFSSKLHLLPSSGMHTVGIKSFSDMLRHLILPCSTLCLGMVATYIRYIRTNTIDQLKEEYVVTALATGNSKYQILRNYILKNTLLPVITLLGMNLAEVVTGSFVIETVFGWPGIGTLVMEATKTRDYPIIMAFILLSGTILVIGNNLADILYAFIDPRIRRESKNE